MNINIKTIANNFVAAISLITALGVFTHDGRIDRAATVAISSIVSLGYAPLGTHSSRFSDFVSTDAHTHPDHSAANRSIISNFFNQAPSIAPKRKSYRKDLNNETSPPRHAFDNSSLPVLE